MDIELSSRAAYRADGEQTSRTYRDTDDSANSLSAMEAGDAPARRLPHGPDLPRRRAPAARSHGEASAARAERRSTPRLPRSACAMPEDGCARATWECATAAIGGAAGTLTGTTLRRHGIPALRAHLAAGGTGAATSHAVLALCLVVQSARLARVGYRAVRHGESPLSPENRAACLQHTQTTASWVMPYVAASTIGGSELALRAPALQTIQRTGRRLLAGSSSSASSAARAASSAAAQRSSSSSSNALLGLLLADALDDDGTAVDLTRFTHNVADPAGVGCGISLALWTTLRVLDCSMRACIERARPRELPT